MTPLEAMKQALEALKPFYVPASPLMVNLTAAISELEQAQPVVFWGEGVNGVYVPDGTPLYAAPPAPATPAGWKLVPVEPTAEMLEAGVSEGTLGGDYGNYLEYADPIRTYHAMLEVAPQPPKEAT